jgi:hypothetical protein
MTKTLRNGSVPIEDEIGLIERIQRELESMTFNKERHDMDYPDHKKDLPQEEMQQMARKKVLQELCIPPCSDDSSTEDRFTSAYTGIHFL